MAKIALKQAADRTWAPWNARNNVEIRVMLHVRRTTARFSRADADCAIKSAKESVLSGAKIDVALAEAVKFHHRAKMKLAEKTVVASSAASEEARAAATAAETVGVDKRKRSLHGDADITMSKVVKADNGSAGGAARSRMHGDDATSDGDGQHVAPGKVDAQRNGFAKAWNFEAKAASKLATLQRDKTKNAEQALVDRTRAKDLNKVAKRHARWWIEAETAVKESPEAEAFNSTMRDVGRKRAALADAEQEVLRLERMFLTAERAASRGEIGSKRVREAISDAEEEDFKRRKKMKEKADRRPKPVISPVLEGFDRLTPARAWVAKYRLLKKGLRKAEGGRAKKAEGRAEPRRSTRQTRGKPAEVFEA